MAWYWSPPESLFLANVTMPWRAVDHEGEVLEAVVTATRDKAAAVKFLKWIMKKYGRPRKIVTDGLCAYSAAMNEIGTADGQEVGPRLNNRAENSHQPFRRRERAMQRFRSVKTLQKFSAVHAQVHKLANALRGPPTENEPIASLSIPIDERVACAPRASSPSPGATSRLREPSSSGPPKAATPGP